ncbi:MAG: S-layer homology domain-containing protein, partial [Candidatus Gracilibacteria bacterium]
PLEDDYEILFPDVVKTDWFFKFVMAAKQSGIVKGYDDGNFKPANEVILSEALKMMLESAKAEIPTEVSDDLYSDVKKDDWFAPYFKIAKNANLVLADYEGKVYPQEKLTRARFAEIVYRMLKVIENGGKPYDIKENFLSYEGEDLPFKIKYSDEFELIKENHAVTFFKKDHGNKQFSSVRTYPNSAKIVVTIDKNEDTLDQASYFDTIKKAFPDASYLDFTFNTFPALEVSYSGGRDVDWYIYLNSGYVLVAYTSYGSGPASFRYQQIIKNMMDSLEYKDMEVSFQEDYSGILSEIFANILVEKKGMESLNKLDDKIIFETDAIGVGTGAVDYYYSKNVDYTFKYERASDVILDKREGKTSAF